VPDDSAFEASGLDEFQAQSRAPRSPRAIRVLGQEASVSVLEKTTLGMSFISAAYGPDARGQ
jgi:hypothetical protein